MTSTEKPIKFKDLSYLFDERDLDFILYDHHFYSEDMSDDSTWFYIYTQFRCHTCDLCMKIKKDLFILFDDENKKLFETNLDNKIDKFITCEQRCDLKLIKNIIE